MVGAKRRLFGETAPCILECEQESYCPCCQTPVRSLKRETRVYKVHQALFTVSLLLTLAFAVLAQAPTQENLLRVEISGLRSDKGQMLCALFASAGDFPKHADKAVKRTTARIADRHAVCEFSGVASGTYAVSVVHDENNNGKLDTNFVGMPREGVGASNNAKGHFGPPKFDAASFRYTGGRLDLKITITYL